MIIIGLCYLDTVMISASCDIQVKRDYCSFFFPNELGHVSGNDKKEWFICETVKNDKNCLSALDKTFSEICQELFHLKEIKKNAFLLYCQLLRVH